MSACKTCNPKTVKSAPVTNPTTGDYQYDGTPFECEANPNLDVAANTSLNTIILKLLTELCALQVTAEGCCLEETTYSALETLVAGSDLVPNKAYIFPYETGHVVYDGLGTDSRLTAGYTPIVENLVIVAKTTTTFFHHAKSMEHPEDDILYDFTLNTVVGNDRPGLIYWRRNNTKNIEAWFDVRNQVVARLSMNKAPITYSSGDINRGIIKYDSAATKLKISLQNGQRTLSNFRMLEDIQILDQHLYGTGMSTVIFGNNIGFGATGMTYHQSIDNVNSSNIKLGINAYDILIDTSNNVNIGNGLQAGATIINSNSINLHNYAYSVVIHTCNGIELGYNCQKIYLFSCYNIKFGGMCQDVILISAQNTNIGSRCQSIFIKSSNSNTIHDETTSVMINRSSNFNTISQGCGGITIGNASKNKFDAQCTDIQVFGGGTNRFAAGCNTINLLGDQDQGDISSVNYYSPYSEMSYNTFGVGCSNITFNAMGGRGNMFGDECKNLLFTDITANVNVNDRGAYDASSNLFPAAGTGSGAAGAIKAYDLYEITVGGTLGGTPVSSLYRVMALVDTPGQTAGNWLITTNAYRVVGCHFVRGIQNKTFKLGLHGCSFLVPCQVTKTITANDFYAQAIWLNGAGETSLLTAVPDPANSPVTADALRDDLVANVFPIMQANIVATLQGDHRLRAWQESNQSITDPNQIIVGYQRFNGTFFGTDAKIYDGSTMAGFRIHGSPTGRAFMWTVDGYPLSMVLTTGLNKSADPTASLNG